MNQVMLFLYFVLATSSYCLASKDRASSLDAYLDKRYDLVSSDQKFDQVLAALGLDSIRRKMAEIAAPAIWLTRQGDLFTLTTDTIFKQFHTRFRLDEEFDEDTIDGRHVRTLFTLDGNLLLQIERGAKTLYTLREFKGDTVRTFMIVDDLTSVRVFKHRPHVA